MNVGDIYLHTKFNYKDEEIGKKLIIVINSPSKNNPFFGLVLFCL